MSEHDEHRAVRELLGSHALGALPPRSRSAVQAHLDGCASCRAELAEIAPLAGDLRTVDPDRLSDLPSPDPRLGERIRTAVAQERALVEARHRAAARRDAGRRTRSRVLAAAAAVAVLAAGVGVGLQVDRTPDAPVVPVEALRLEGPGGTAPAVQTAGLIAHTWGVEVRMVASGFAEGRTFRAAFRSRDGRLLPAGEFLGTGERSLTCNLQAALLRPDTVGFVITDASGAEVLTTSLA